MLFITYDIPFLKNDVESEDESWFWMVNDVLGCLVYSTHFSNLISITSHICYLSIYIRRAVKTELYLNT